MSINQRKVSEREDRTWSSFKRLADDQRGPVLDHDLASASGLSADRVYQFIYTWEDQGLVSLDENAVSLTELGRQKGPTDL